MPDKLAAVQAVFFLALLCAASVFDLKRRIIPDRLNLAIAATSLLCFSTTNLWGIAVAVPFLLAAVFCGAGNPCGGMGGGDIKLFFTVGLFGSLRTDLLVVLLACLIGIGLALLPQKTAHEGEPSGAIPFGPAISAAAVLSLLWGEPFVAAYLSLFA